MSRSTLAGARQSHGPLFVTHPPTEERIAHLRAPSPSAPLGYAEVEHGGR